MKDHTLPKVFFDLETTGINSHFAEIIEGYFETDSGKSFEIKCRVEKWSEDAAKIHGISYSDMLTYNDPYSELHRLFDWLPKQDFEFITYANTSRGENYDVGVLRAQSFWMQVDKGYDDFYYKSWMPIDRRSKKTSVWELAKQRIKLPKKTRYTQENIAKYFGFTYSSHRAKDDVKAMKKIYKRLA